MSEETLSRRGFLSRAFALGVMATGTTALFSACDKGGGESGGLNCTDVSGLNEAQAAVRTSLSYVDSSTQAEKWCHNCSQFNAAAEGSCGSCNLIAGPIHPDGYCSSWVALAT